MVPLSSWRPSLTHFSLLLAIQSIVEGNSVESNGVNSNDHSANKENQLMLGSDVPEDSLTFGLLSNVNENADSNRVSALESPSNSREIQADSEPCSTLDFGLTGETICPGSTDSIITLLDLKTEKLDPVPETLSDPSTLFHGLVHYKGWETFEGQADGLAGEVSFSVHHPFGPDRSMTTILQYHEVGATIDPETQKVYLDPICDSHTGVGCPSPTHKLPVYRAGCIQPKVGGTPFTVVTVLFMDDTDNKDSAIGKGGKWIEPYPNCPIEKDVATDSYPPMIEYTFKILCDCPEAGATRHFLRKN